MKRSAEKGHEAVLEASLPPYKRRPSLRRRITNQKSKHQASRAHPEHTLRSVVVVVDFP
jgi:hypothetical protein